MICLSNSANPTLHDPIASMSHCLRIRLVRLSCCLSTFTTHTSPACDTGVHDAMRVIRYGVGIQGIRLIRGETQKMGDNTSVYMGKQSR